MYYLSMVEQIHNTSRCEAQSQVNDFRGCLNHARNNMKNERFRSLKAEESQREKRDDQCQIGRNSEGFFDQHYITRENYIKEETQLLHGLGLSNHPIANDLALSDVSTFGSFEERDDEQIPHSVRFVEPLITQTWHFPPVDPKMLSLLFYSEEDLYEFREILDEY
mmetsp:Transcript_7/g.12  ORF Transcript_7/g.12 Transcript_7/m.12 type:complete len:165 (+) Transcript_7:38-532(+)